MNDVRFVFVPFRYGRCSHEKLDSIKTFLICVTVRKLFDFEHRPATELDILSLRSAQQHN